MAPTSKKGFIIYDMCEMGRVRLYSLGHGVLFERSEACPLCKTLLETVCVLIGNEGSMRVRIGACGLCGYIGYQDRPSQEWIVDFYKNNWDEHIALNSEHVRNLPDVSAEKKGSRRSAVELACSLVQGSGHKALEIGSGYGQVLRRLVQHGFSSVIGVENSKHRAQVVAEVLKKPVFVGNFEGSEVQAALVGQGPFDLVISHHVFEHVVDPNKFIGALSACQPEDGIFVLGVPDVAGEHAGYITLYPPHLHSYSRYGIEQLLNRFGYEVIEDRSESLDNMLIAARKTRNPKPFFSAPQNALGASLAKLYRGLGIKEIPSQGLAQLWWLRSVGVFDDSRVTQWSRWNLVERVRWYIAKAIYWALSKIGRFTASHGMLVGPLAKKYTDAPIELQWPGDITFLFK